MTSLYEQVRDGVEVDLSSSHIGDDGTREIARALRDPTARVISLLLVNNGIGKDGAVAIAEALRNGNNTTLMTLDLGYNNIGKDGAVAIADALQNGNHTLTTLNLRYNNIGKDGAAAIANALRNGNTTLTMLELCYNNIGKGGAMAIADALRNGNTTLMELDLRWNVGSLSGAELRAFNNVVAGIEVLLSQRRERMATAMETVRQKINEAVANRDAEPVDIQSPVIFEAAMRKPRALLGTGTFGAVYLIVDPALFYGRPFAVKRIKLGLDEQQRQVSRRTFRTEIQVSIALL
jgi:Ran GTPase-activating protein (RanGAP) involved in mRNA processing and transport